MTATLQRIAAGQAPVPGCTTAAAQAMPDCNTALPMPDRVRNLISLLLPAEKVPSHLISSHLISSPQPFLMEARQSPDSNITRLGKQVA